MAPPLPSPFGSGRGLTGWSALVESSPMTTLHTDLGKGEALPHSASVMLLKRAQVRTWQKKRWECLLYKNQTIVTVLKRKLDGFKISTTTF